MAETYYDVLGVPRDASRDEIRAAYRERVLETHPDHNDDPDAAAQFGRVREAEEVLTDEAERARYDRLGHEAYLGIESGEEEVAGTGDGTGDDRVGSVAEAAARAAERAANEADDRGPSHHARQRARRRRATARAEARAEWWFGNDSAGVSAGRARAKTTSTGRARTTAAGSRGREEFSYSVHGWDDEVDLADDRPPIDQSTAITAGAVALFYPLLVYGSIAPAFPLAVNLVVAACTLVLVGSLLTVPRAALAAFGVWGVLAPIALVWHPTVGPFSPIGLLALVAAWVPLGYAVALRWAVRY